VRAATARLLGALRAAAFLAAALGATLGASAHEAKTRMSEALLGIGSRLMRDLDEARTQTGPRRLFVNGLTLHLATASFDRDVRTVLDDFEARCGTSGESGRARRTVERRNEGPARTPETVWAVTERIDGEVQGMVACLDTGRALGLGELTARLRAFAGSGDLGAIGELRSLVARRSGAQTHALVLWTERSARLGDLFPPSGDSPGADPDGFPRPDGARRLLSARLDGEPYALTLFAVPRPVESVASATTSALRAAGWSLDRLGEPARESFAWLARRRSAVLIVRIAPGQDRGSVVSVVTLA
jgi:hypothetical protein